MPGAIKVAGLELHPLDALLAFLPLAVVLEIAHAPPWAVFAASCAAIVPLAGWMGRATEHLAAHYGAGLGGLLNATFGNAAELIIAIFALRAGLYDLVKASITGSIIGNTLLVLGLAILAGGLRHPRQAFNATAAGLGTTLLVLSATGLVIPAIFHAIVGEAAPIREHRTILAISVVLFASYLLSLVFSLRTHRHLFAGEGGGGGAADRHGTHPDAPWSRRRSIVVLLASTALVALMSEFLVGSAEATAERFGMTEMFIGVVLVAIIGNAAEHSTAVLMAMRNKMDLAITIAVGSGIQIALFVAPVLVFLSYAIGGGGALDLVFSPLEVVTLVLSVMIVASVAHDGASNWMEGVLLLAVYVIVAIAFFYLPAT